MIHDISLIARYGATTTTTSFQPFQLLKEFEAKASVASRRREKRQERAKIRAGLGLSTGWVRVKGCVFVVEFSNEIYLMTELRPDLKFKNRVFFLDLFHRAYMIS